MRSSLSLCFAFALAACGRSEPEKLQADPTPPVRSAAPAPSPSAPPTPVASASAAPPGPLVLARGIRMVHAGKDTDAARAIRAVRDREKADGRDVVVYVGAKWCEPCQRFHKAAEAGQLDAEFPTLSVVEFDLDEDRERLLTANYNSTYIPLFVVPDADGRGSSKRFEGSVKGDGAIANIAPRLRQILGR